jgi:hypothetical protein
MRMEWVTRERPKIDRIACPWLNTSAIDAALEVKGTINGGVYQFSIPRAESISEGGMAVPPPRTEGCD